MSGAGGKRQVMEYEKMTATNFIMWQNVEKYAENGLGKIFIKR
jgi:hypothetical protein